jgi:hypothetical protein
MQTWKVFASASMLAFSLEAGAVGGLADLSIYDRTEGRSLPVHWHQGAAYVVGKPGNEYQITLRSRWSEDLLAVVSVDGVNVITGETASPQQSGYVLSLGRSFDILGWRKSLAQTAAFYFTSLSDSYAARTGRPADAGVIGVALFRRKQEPHSIGDIAPSERSADSEASPRAAEGLGTGHGRRETSYARYASFERASNTPQETIAIYYDSYRNLVARGIIREALPLAPHPRPFPGFVPDPQTWLPAQPIGG